MSGSSFAGTTSAEDFMDINSEFLLMNVQDRNRLTVLSLLKSGAVSQTEAAVRLKMSTRQVRRLALRHALCGAAGVLHASRGQPSHNRAVAGLKDRAIELYQTRYKDFGPTLASEQLFKRDGLTVHPETLRLWLIEADLWKRHRKRARHRSWREARSQFGDLVQMDGSRHDWFEDRAAGCFLMNMVDDATGTTLSLHSEEETTFAAMQLLESWIRLYGIPKSLYVDLKNVYVAKERQTTLAEDRARIPVQSQFERACSTLDIGLTKAHPPQAKGRVERSHGVYQDRWVKQLRLDGISSIEAANLALSPFIAELNLKFARPPRSPSDAHRVLDRQIDLRSVFCIQEPRVVARDWTVKFDNRNLQIVQQQRRGVTLPRPTAIVNVQRWQDGTLHIRNGETELMYKELTKEMMSSARKLLQLANLSERPAPSEQRKPSPDHPWREYKDKVPVRSRLKQPYLKRTF
jgi:hypothetical protein